MKDMTYIISHVTHWDSDNMLWMTYVGKNTKDLPLLFTVWGETEEKSRQNAQNLVKQLIQNVKEP